MTWGAADLLFYRHRFPLAYTEILRLRHEGWLIISPSLTLYWGASQFGTC
jgi:hypothetical protein